MVSMNPAKWVEAIWGKQGLYHLQVLCYSLSEIIANAFVAVDIRIFFMGLYARGMQKLWDQPIFINAML